MNKNPPIQEIKNGKLSAFLLPTGDIYKICYNQTMLNMYPGSTLDGSLYNLYLKVENEFTSLIGIFSPSSFSICKNQVYYQGSFKEVNYMVVLTFMEDTWFTDVFLNAKEKVNTTVYYGFDVGLANEGINEAYNSQYIDHKVLEREGTFVILSKQNQGVPFLLETSSLSPMDSYSTDGFQFFKKDYKFSNVPEALKKNHLEQCNYQYEFAFLAFQTKEEAIGEKHYTFYQHVTDSYTTFPTKAVPLKKITSSYQKIEFLSTTLKFSRLHLAHSFNQTYCSPQMSEKEIRNEFEVLRNIQYDEKKEHMLSFFSKNHEYVVLQEMERHVERPTGMVFIGNGFKSIEKSPLAFTSYIHGVFASHIVLGNTDFNSFTQESKTPLNVLKCKGLRIFVRLNGTYQLLTLPAAYKMGVNYATWYYKINDDLLTITTAITYDSDKIEVEINSKNQIKYDFLLSNFLHMGDSIPKCEIKKQKVRFYFASDTFVYQKHAKMYYEYQLINQPLHLVGDSFFFKEKVEDNYPFFAHQVEKTNHVRILIGASYEEEKTFTFEPIEKIKEEYYLNFLQNICNIELKGKNPIIEKLSDLTIWYVQNALIHYASPHGLEQFSGAAWGCRDVCQGPFELFLTCGHFQLAKDILLKVYSRQFAHNYDWPQWFMFDEYASIQAGESHGDVIVWPLKALAEYLKRSNDLSILDEEVPFFDFYLGRPNESKESIKQHLLKQIKAICDSFISPYHLSTYGGGDWDDTLQPKNKEQANKMVSGWTIALTLDALQTYIECVALSKYDCAEIKKMYDDMKKDYYNVLIKDDIPAGFVYFNGNKIEYILHPKDVKSNIRYRLLPLTRGMIAQLFSEEQVSHYLKIIKENLMYSDGVRLMSEAIQYRGGENLLFNRAETAANFGREIGLQYVHAHIRYCEAMAMIGENELLYDGLQKIIPIKIEDVVENACIRQGNVYFSSSDGAFKDRYEACRNFEKLKTKEIKVKSGWRLYSSGPGIFLNQVYSHFFGISFYQNKLLIDPILTSSMDGTILSFDYHQKHIQIHYHIKNEKNRVTKVQIGNKVFMNTLKNTYRSAGILVSREELVNDCHIDVYCG